MSDNLCNLPKQITAEDGTLVNYTYFADGTKFKAVDAAGSGFVYTGSLRCSVENGALAPESVTITGGRAVFADHSWATNYYITDHLGSVRAVTDAEVSCLAHTTICPMVAKFLQQVVPQPTTDLQVRSYRVWLIIASMTHLFVSRTPMVVLCRLTLKRRVSTISRLTPIALETL